MDTFGIFTAFEKRLTFIDHDQIEVLSMLNIRVYHFSTLAFSFWEQIAIEITACNIYVVILSEDRLGFSISSSSIGKGLVAPQVALLAGVKISIQGKLIL